jgi:quinol monooxygenase YgiN
MLIIAGHLVVSPTERDDYVRECAATVMAARQAAGCLDFSITADSVDPARIRIYERWEGEEQLLAFRGSRRRLRRRSVTVGQISAAWMARDGDGLDRRTVGPCQV